MYYSIFFCFLFLCEQDVMGSYVRDVNVGLYI